MLRSALIVLGAAVGCAALVAVGLVGAYLSFQVVP